jgi:Temperature dependent protein affecting M2 dsRNA replication
LKDSAFVPKSTSKPPNSVLRSTDEIIYNVLWRFLQLRGFVNEKYELTSWGLALEAAISALDSADKMEEYVFVAIEMLRMGLVNGKDMTSIPGGAEYGTGKEEPTQTL